jgi:exodeoxyribonuclease VII large subunit
MSTSNRLPPPGPLSGPGPGEPVYTVSELNRAVRGLLEKNFPLLWVAGEVSNLARPASGHLYFSLKDEAGQVRCALFRGAQRTLRFRIENGQQLLVRARVSLFDARGDYQLLVEHAELAGDGLLLRKLEELKARLAAEGLFDAARKRPLPALPRAVGVITSPTGAALRDILHILARRFPAVAVIVYPVQVQGERAKFDVAGALKLAGERAECDVLILARGGGALEDLWAFNEEIVARAMCECPIPIVSGVGHEVDFTIADFVADVRAPTPSGAAEIVVPDAREWLRNLAALAARAEREIAGTLQGLRDRLEALEARLRLTHPGVILRQHAQRLDELAGRISAALLRVLDGCRVRVRHARRNLRRNTPRELIAAHAAGLATNAVQLRGAMQLTLAAVQQRLAVDMARLQAVSPLGTLERGYAIVRDHETGRVIRGSGEVARGQRIDATLASGELEAVVVRAGRGTPRSPA